MINPVNPVNPVRVSLSVRWQLAEAEGYDRAMKTPRGQSGPVQREVMAQHGIVAPCRVLPLFGDRWPESVQRRCDAISRKTFLRSL